LAYFYTKNYTKAEVDFSSCIAMGMADHKAYCFRGATFHYLNKDDLALEDLNKSISINKNYESGYYYRALVKYAAEDDAGCVADCDKALEINKSYDTYYTRAISKFQLKDYNGALLDFNESLKLKPNYFLATLERGITYYMLEKDELAKADLNKAIELDNKTARGYYFRGKLKKYANDLVGACADLKTSEKLGYSKATDELLKNGCK
jgi:tetratricopeptide (TPR) repeat protein